jgi:hypothetical protein
VGDEYGFHVFVFVGALEKRREGDLHPEVFGSEWRSGFSELQCESAFRTSARWRFSVRKELRGELVACQHIMCFKVLNVEKINHEGHEGHEDHEVKGEGPFLLIGFWF